jgi:hypothetical protein
MEKMAIHAASPESAYAMLAALSPFGAELADDGALGREVVVDLHSDDAEIVAVLHALQKYVTERADGPARVELNGHRYVMHAELAGSSNGGL